MTIPILINFKNGEEGAKFFEWVCGYKPIKEGGSEIILLSGWHTKDNTRAAPDLLEACKSALDFIEYASDDLEHRGETLTQKDKLLSTITKAEGTA